MFNQRKYGITRETKSPIEEDSLPDKREIVLTLYEREDKAISPFLNSHYSPLTYAQICQQLGFAILYEYHPNALDRPFLDDLINAAPSIGMILTK